MSIALGGCATAVPTIDGKLDDPAWATAQVIPLEKLEMGGAASVESVGRIIVDGKTLYLAVESFDDAATLKALTADITGHDEDGIWQDDEVELFVDPTNMRESYYQIIVNTLGTVQDSDTRDGLWNGEVRAAGRKGKGFWDLEVAVKLSSMKAKAAPGTTWGMNLCRDRWAGREENSSWAFVGASFHTPRRFGRLRFEE